MPTPQIWKFPVYLPVNRPGGERLCLLATTGSFEVGESDPRQMVPAFVVDRGEKNERHYASHEGALYIKTTTRSIFDSVRKRADIMRLDVGSSNPVYEEYTARIFDEWNAHRDTPKWPRDYYAQRAEGLPDLFSKGFRPTGNWEALLDRQTSMFEKIVSGYLIVGDDVWKRTSEPIYTYDPDGAMADVMSADVYDDAFLASRHYVLNTSFGARAQFLSANDFEKLTAAAGQHARFLPEIEVLDPSMLKADFERLEFDRFARMSVHHIGQACSRQVSTDGADPVSVIHDIPADALVAWVRLRDFLKTYRPLADGVPDDLELLLQECMEHAYATPSIRAELDRMTLTRDKFLNLLENWQDRRISIELPATRSAAAPR